MIHHQDFHGAGAISHPKSELFLQDGLPGCLTPGNEIQFPEKGSIL